MKLIDTSTLTPQSIDAMGATERLQIYNGLDCCVTHEVDEVITQDFNPLTLRTYDFSRRLQAPVLEMNMRGVLIDQYELSRLIVEFEEALVQLKWQFDHICTEVFGETFSMSSPLQMKRLFYDVLRLPEIKKRNAKGERVVTTDRAALEKLRAHFYAQPFVSHILGCRDLEKKLQFLRSDIDADSRLRTSFNIAGTNTGRFASNFSDFGSGTNLQNIERKLRRVIVSDPGYKFCNIDIEQGDSRNLGFLLGELFNDWDYLDACESGDLHTIVSRAAWPGLPWTGDPKQDRAIADGPFYRMFSYRDMAKRLGHGTNFLGTPYTMAENTKLPQRDVKTFQSGYFSRFPGLSKYHDHVRWQLRTVHKLVTPFGRERHFYGRADDDTTVREAVAYCPQSMTAEEINIMLEKAWDLNIAQCLLQVHDSILFQYREDQEAVIVPKLLECCRVSLTSTTGRVFNASTEAKIGWNWADTEFEKDGSVKENPDGLRKWKGSDPRRRSASPKTSVLDRVLPRIDRTPRFAANPA